MKLVVLQIIERREINAAGGVAEMLGHLFGTKGRVPHTRPCAQIVSVALHLPKGQRIIMARLALGKAILTVLTGNLLAWLISDKVAARAGRLSSQRAVQERC
nr:sugar-binding domain-containing protein [Paracoccus saliphilus]